MNKAIEDRRSIRKFKPDVPVTKDQLEQLLTAAMYAPSAKNARPWEFIAIIKRETLDEIADMYSWWGMCKTATAAIVIIGIPRDKLWLVDYKDGNEDLTFSGDYGAATQNILLEASTMGLGTCWLGVYPYEERMGKIAKLLHIEQPKYPFNIIPIGTPDETPARRGSYDAAKVTFIE